MRDRGTKAARAGLALAALALVAAACGGGDGDGDDGEAIDGEAVYLAHCASCHADDGSGGTGQAIGDGGADAYSAEELVDLVAAGRNGMPAFADRLSPAEIASVVDFVRDDLEIGDDGATGSVFDRRSTRRRSPSSRSSGATRCPAGASSSTTW